MIIEFAKSKELRYQTKATSQEYHKIISVLNDAGHTRLLGREEGMDKYKNIFLW